MTPAVSIVLPFRNAAATLNACLSSIERQTCSCYELLAIDDGSDDHSAQLLRQRTADDPRVRLLQPGRVGLVAALNLGIRHARAPLIARMDADDVMHPERLEAQIDYLAQHPEIVLVGSQVALFPRTEIKAGYREYVRWQNQCLEPQQIANHIYVESPLAHPSIMVRRDVITALGGYADGPFPEDYELWLRIHDAGLLMGKVPRILLYWRESSSRTSRVDPRYERTAFDRLRAEYLARDARLHQGRAIVVWGAGRRTRLRARHLLQRGIQPQAWIDIDPRKIGNSVWGLPVHPPAWLQQDRRPFVLIYVTAHGARELAAEHLSAFGYRLGEDYLCVG